MDGHRFSAFEILEPERVGSILKNRLARRHYRVLFPNGRKAPERRAIGISNQQGSALRIDLDDASGSGNERFTGLRLVGTTHCENGYRKEQDRCGGDNSIHAPELLSSPGLFASEELIKCSSGKLSFRWGRNFRRHRSGPVSVSRQDDAANLG